MTPGIVIGAIAAAALAVSVALAWMVVRGAERRGQAAAMVAGFGVALIAVFVVQMLLAVYGASALIAALIAALLTAVVLFYFVGREVRWRWTRLLALFGVALSCIVLTLMAGVSLGDRIAPERAARMARVAGFDVLLPTWLPAMRDVEGLINVPPGGAPISLTWVEQTPEPDAGIRLGYNGLDINERKTGTGLSLAQLEAPLPTDAVRTPITVHGMPALLVEYEDDTVAEGSLVHELFFETDDLTVNMRGLSKEQLVRVAESLTTR